MNEHYEPTHPDVDAEGTAEDLEDDLADRITFDGVSDDESYLDEDATALWEGDRGSLDAKQRDTLVALLKKAFISSDDRAEWRTLVRDPGPIATNLNNLYLNLVIDERGEVAYATPARTADNLFKTLVRDAPNNREETLLLIYLRERFRAETAGGQAHVFADAVAMYDYVSRIRPASATDKIADEGRVTNAIKGLVSAGILVKTKDEGRYRVHRAIEALLPLTKLNQLLEAFRRQSASDPADTDSTGDVFSPSGKHAAPDLSGLATAEAEAAEAEGLGEESDSYEESA